MNQVTPKKMSDIPKHTPKKQLPSNIISQQPALNSQAFRKNSLLRYCEDQSENVEQEEGKTNLASQRDSLASRNNMMYQRSLEALKHK